MTIAAGTSMTKGPRVTAMKLEETAVVNGIRDGDGSGWYINDERTEGHSREVGRDSSRRGQT